MGMAAIRILVQQRVVQLLSRFPPLLLARLQVLQLQIVQLDTRNERTAVLLVAGSVARCQRSLHEARHGSPRLTPSVPHIASSAASGMGACGNTTASARYRRRSASGISSMLTSMVATSEGCGYRGSRTQSGEVRRQQPRADVEPHLGRSSRRRAPTIASASGNRHNVEDAFRCGGQFGLGQVRSWASSRRDCSGPSTSIASCSAPMAAATSPLRVVNSTGNTGPRAVGTRTRDSPSRHRPARGALPCPRGSIAEEWSSRGGYRIRSLVSERSRRLAHLADKVGVPRPLTDAQPDDTVGKGRLNGFIVAERLRQDGLADPSHTLEPDECDVLDRGRSGADAGPARAPPPER